MPKGLVLILSLTLIAFTLQSACTDIKPSIPFDCVSKYLPDQMCCYHKVTTLSQIEITCFEQPMSRSNEYESGKTTGREEIIDCKLGLSDFCSSSKYGCTVGDKVVGGICCHDKKQNVCFTRPYHFKKEGYDCPEGEDRDSSGVLLSVKYLALCLLLLLF